MEGRFKALCAVRIGVSAAALAAYYALDVGFGAEAVPVRESPALIIHAGYFVYSLLSLLLLATRADRRRLILGQLAIDVLVVSALTYAVGPLRAHTYAYFAIVIAAALMLSFSAGIGLASFSSSLLVAVTGLYFAAVRLQLPELPLPAGAAASFDSRPEFLIPFLFFFVISLHVVAWLAGKLADEISRVRILNDEILFNMAGGVIAVDRYGTIAFANPQAAALLDLKDPPARLAGRDFARVLPAEVADLYRQVLAGGDPVGREIRVGRTPVEISIAPLGDGRKGRRGAVAIFNDLTLRNQVEHMQQRAERFRGLLEMSAGMAHEIRNPLASIRGAVQELDGDSVSEDDRKLHQVILRESDRLNKIVSDFLEYATERPMEFSLVNVADVARETSELLAARTPAPRTRVRLELPRQATCRGDADRLQQVFLNLGLNAVEADAPQLVIRCVPAAEPEGGLREGVLVEFEDNGPGIQKEHLDKLFTPFFTTKPRGTGMGLAIARKIVLAHEGTIAVESEPGKGSVARVWLPSS